MKNLKTRPKDSRRTCRQLIAKGDGEAHGGPDRCEEGRPVAPPRPLAEEKKKILKPVSIYRGKEWASAKSLLGRMRRKTPSISGRRNSSYVPAKESQFLSPIAKGNRKETSKEGGTEHCTYATKDDLNRKEKCGFYGGRRRQGVGLAREQRTADEEIERD